MNPGGQFFMTQRGQFRMAFDTEAALQPCAKSRIGRLPVGVAPTSPKGCGETLFLHSDKNEFR